MDAAISILEENLADKTQTRLDNIVIESARSLPWAAADPPPKVVVRNFGESSVDLQLRVWITDARKRMDTISEVTDRVKTAFDGAGIQIPFPRRDITIIRKSATGSAASSSKPALPQERPR
ncbi:MAG: hypothetical protein ABIL58_19865 [Pseudomonadota bacterium]